MDTNWFYSTLAQSTATVVGLAGGFLFTWLLSRRVELIEERRTYIDQLNGIIEQLEGLKRQIDTVRLQTEGALQHIRDQLATGVSYSALKIPQFGLLSHRASEVPYPSVEDIIVLRELPLLYTQLQQAIVNDRGDLGRALVLAKPLESRDEPAYHTVAISHEPFQATGIHPENFWSGMRVQKDYAIWKWQEIAREYDRLALALKNFRERLVPGSIYFPILILFGLVSAGMVVPMAFLSAHVGAWKWVLLALSSLLIVAFMGYLAYEVRRLRQAADSSRDTI